MEWLLSFIPVHASPVVSINRPIYVFFVTTARIGEENHQQSDDFRQDTCTNVILFLESSELGENWSSQHFQPKL